MKKQDLLEHIQQAIRTEESAVAIFMRHLSAMILRSGLREEEIFKIRQTINFLVAENKKHKLLLESLYDRIAGEQANDF